MRALQREMTDHFHLTPDDLPKPPRIGRRGSVFAGRAPIFMMAAGALLAAVAGAALFMISRAH